MHPYLCSCRQCEYARIVKLMYDKYRIKDSPYLTDEDPFPSNDHKTGRFKVNNPNEKQKPRKEYTTYYKHPDGNFYQDKPYDPRSYRRIFNPQMDMIEFQYKPWPEAEWSTYHRISSEVIHNTTEAAGIKWAAHQFHMNAARDLSKERFYKIERVDQTA